jgi:hypothetical protein
VQAEVLPAAAEGEVEGSAEGVGQLGLVGAVEVAGEQGAPLGQQLLLEATG